MKTSATLVFLLCSFISFSQKEVYKFAKLTPADLEKKAYAIDSSASAVYLADVGSTEIVGNNKGGFSLQFKRHARIHILNKNGYDEATVEIPLYSSGNAEQKIDALKATTYNLENGAVVESKFDKDNLFSEKRSRNWTVKKFTLPNVKEGCIIDFEYRILSDYVSILMPWEFQGSAPRLWSDYTVSIPQFLQYAFMTRGFNPFYINEKKDHTTVFSIFDPNGTAAAETYHLKSGVTDYRWVLKDVKAFKEESFTSSSKNYTSAIEFQLSGYRDPLPYKNLLDTWETVTKELLEDTDFGRTLDNANNWMGDIVKPLIANATTPAAKAKAIFNYVRDNTTCTDHDALYIAQPLKSVLRAKNGRVSEINLLLTAMLKYAGIEAEPVILSTKENGFVHTLYPMLTRFNYVITAAQIDGKTYYLDASQPQLGFGRLLPYCYNGYARTISSTHPDYLVFSSDSLRENKLTSVFISNDDKGVWSGRMKQTQGYFESYRTRKRIAEKGQDDYFKELKKGYNFDIDIKGAQIDSLSQREMPLSVQYDFVIRNDEDILYVNPLFSEVNKENPFKADERAYPVEMPYTTDETYLLTMEVPKGYTVDELPKPMIVKFNEAGDCQFEYMVTQSNDIISLRSRVQLRRATFDPSEYEVLREFFNMIVSKQSEQIVFKKKK